MASKTVSVTSNPARLAQVTMLCCALPEQVDMWRSTSRRLPTMPTGSGMPGWLSRTKWRGGAPDILFSYLADARAEVKAGGGVDAEDVGTSDADHALVDVDAD